MKLLVVLALVTVALARPNDFYDSKYDNFNIAELLENVRLLKSFVFCINEDGSCTPEGNEIKGWVPEAISTTCAKCTDKQKNLVAVMVKAVKEQLPAEYDKLKAKHDSEGKYEETLNTFVTKYA